MSSQLKERSKPSAWRGWPQYVLPWIQFERQLSCLAAYHVESDAVLVIHCSGALVGDLHYNLRVVTGRDRSPEVEQVPGIGGGNHHCAIFRHELSANAINSEKVHTLASIVMI